jgi:3-methyl-2-oxobutanoate hydroxymethyltransferase
VLVWTDMAGMRTGNADAASGESRVPKFVKAYADVRSVLLDAATHFADDVRSREYPDVDHSYS